MTRQEIAGSRRQVLRRRQSAERDVCEPRPAQYRTFGYGHSFGVLCHYYGREGGLELREDCDTVLEPGMVVSMEPMIMIPKARRVRAVTASMTFW